MSAVQEDSHVFLGPSDIEDTAESLVSHEDASSDDLKESPVEKNHCNDSSENSSEKSAGYWYCEQKYQWYWQHYNQLQQWLHLQQVAYWRAKAVAMEYENHLLQQHLTHLYMGKSPQNLPSFLPSYLSNLLVHPSHKMGKHRNSSLMRPDCDMPKHKVQAKKRGRRGRIGNSTSDISSVSLEMEVTEELLTFFEQTERHRQKLKKERQDTEESQQQSSSRASSRASKRRRNRSKKRKTNWRQCPKEQAGLRRRTEMKKLYGEAAPMIYGMETAMQLTFDRNCDLKQPKHWPNIPLKL